MDLVAYVDVDDTLVRSFGSKRIPMSSTIEHVRQLYLDGVQLDCWSSGGAEYAKQSALELGIADCFVGFLPKPQVMIDDMAVGKWRKLLQVHPAEAANKSAEEYRRMLG